MTGGRSAASRPIGELTAAVQAGREPRPRVWMHHIEVHSATGIDDEVRGWIGTAYDKPA